MVTRDEHQILALAKLHLGFSTDAPDGVVPNTYIQELRKHMILYPHDTKYRLILEPGRGLGRLTCLEQGCNGCAISLIRRFSASDGGLRDGLGSLSAYRQHIATHPTHVTCRDHRMQQERSRADADAAVQHAVTSPSSSVETERSRLLNAPSASTFLQTTLPPAIVKVKPELMEARIPPPYASTSTQSLHDSAGRVSSLVRTKLEPTSTTSMLNIPLRRVNSLAQIKPEVNEAQIPLKLKRHSDVAFGSRDVEQTLPLTVDKRRKVEDLQVAVYPQPPANQPSQLDVETIRTKISLVQDEITAEENILNRLECKRKPTKLDLRRIDMARIKLTSLRRRKYELNASIPNVPSIKRTLSRPHFPALPLQANNKLDVDPFHHQPTVEYQPVASGSNVRISGASNDDDKMDVDLSGYGDSAEMQYQGSLVLQIAPLPNASIFGGNDGWERDAFMGPQAKADDIDKFLLDAGNAEQFDGNAKIDQALQKLGLTTQYDLVPGMQVPLMPHQTIGVAWMVEKEKSSHKGGCLADDMGLGKTVQMIATLVKNRSEDPMRRTNLILAPTALLDQWKLEIEMKTNCNLQCLIYHGTTKPRRKQDLLRYDVIITTYTTMAFEWPDIESEMKKAKARKKDDFIDDSNDDMFTPKKKERGLLFQVEFWRIILDEAQSIRNRRTRTSRAVADLSSVYRWCLTGTPIVNGLADVYGYLRFLKIRPWYDFQEFRRHVGVLEKKNPALAVSRLQTILKTFLLRRMKTTTMDGKRLIELPEKTVSLIKLQFSEEERDIYKMVEAKAQVNFNRFLKAGTVLKNYHQVLVLLLRLRQICSHPSLIQEGESALISPEEAQEDSTNSCEEISRARRLVSAEFVDKVKSKFKASALQRMEAEKNSEDASAEDEECPICFDIFTDAVITPCTHVFCRECLVDVLNTPAVVIPDDANKYKPNERPCPSCRSPICDEKLFSRSAFLPSDEDLMLDAGQKNIKVEEGKHRGTQHKIEDLDVPMESYSNHDDDMSDFIVEDDEDEDEKDARRMLMRRLGKRKANVVVDSDDEETPEEEGVLFGRSIPCSPEAVKLMPKFLPSTKMKYMMERLQELVETHPEEKTLIVSQWTGCLSLVSNYLSEHGIIHVKYQGDMNRVKRDQAIRVFMAKDKARVMLMSLKCGGVGLNLTRANNVISLDLGWSQAIESQSFDRVHRLGQTRPVVVQRLVISDTVEDRVLALQERKKQLADGSLGEGSGKKIGRLTVKELANLFGLDHRGRLLK